MIEKIYIRGTEMAKADDLAICPKVIATMEFDFSKTGNYSGVQPYFEYIANNVYYNADYITDRDSTWYIKEEGLYQFNISYYNDITISPNVHFSVTTQLVLEGEDNTKGLSTFNMGYCKEYDTHSFILKAKAGDAFYPAFDNSTGSGGPIGVATLIKLT